MDNQVSLNSQGRLLNLLLAGFYILFTLLVNSHSLMVAWPGVFFLQIGLLVPIIWLLWQIAARKNLLRLGNYLDSLVILIILGIIVSTVTAEFHHQAIWYSFMAIGYLSGLYSLNNWLNQSKNPDKLLFLQGFLNIIFIIVSLVVWLLQTVLPELSQIESLTASYNVQLALDISTLELRNWAPIGHQNYVAGYLILSLPLLVGLFLIDSGRRRWFWLGGVILGLVDLYTTQSRGGWLGMVVAIAVGILLLILKQRRRAYILILPLIAIAIALVLISPRLINTLNAISKGNLESELAYRVINWQIGWRMALDNPLSGVGLGGVPLLYQKYLPVWGGRESELTYQLHSTVAQLLGEMGIWGILILLGAIAWLIWGLIGLVTDRFNLTPRESILVGSIYSALFGYATVSIFDYQLDNVSITGTIIIFTAYLANKQNTSQVLSLPRIRLFILVGVGLIISMIIWLLPIHHAWLLSNQGFTALAREEFDNFVTNLSKAHEIVPWKPYYPYQLGWNIGNLALVNNQPDLIPVASEWLETGINTSPYWEFGYSNLAWLSITQQPTVAMANFKQAAELLPVKRGVFYGLGLSLLAQGKTEQAVQAITLEALRYPLFITSPIWRSPQLQPLYQQVTARLLAQYNSFLPDTPLANYWRQCRGSLYWWLGNFDQAKLDLQEYGNPLSQTLLKLSTNSTNPQDILPAPTLTSSLVIEAWYQPEKRLELLQQAWVYATRTPPPQFMTEDLLTSMANSDSFYQWLTQKAPVWQYRRQRLGFNFVNRHLDGVPPTDFLTVVENFPMTEWFSDVFPTLVTNIELDRQLQPLREEFLSSL